MSAESVALTARGLSVRGRRGPVFEGVDVDVPAAGLLVVHGPGGSGRSSLLLTLSGRMRPATGAARVGAHRLPGEERRVRELVAVASAGPAGRLEPRLRVREVMAERRWISPGASDERMREAFGMLDIAPRAGALVGELSSDDWILFALGLALAQRPAAVLVDDVDADCTAGQRDTVWQALARVCRTGVTVLASTVTPPPRLAVPPVLVALPRRSEDRLPPNP
ncbi:ATP-binding cassette domain-containing protein [Sciscionella sediminilitoris]|uniref:ATP-binding cassette domain-containing protein n=1 Tax=Sciscionella sediminilitoris TaxID=1445613 RepID=UPI0004DF2D90|nr:ATP-binding cassette domain-containing protein [Sciscionella sp. SE31]